jgi:hypothetical protein
MVMAAAGHTEEQPAQNVHFDWSIEYMRVKNK